MYLQSNSVAAQTKVKHKSAQPIEPSNDTNLKVTPQNSIQVYQQQEGNCTTQQQHCRCMYTE